MTEHNDSITWRRSSFCASSACVEVARVSNGFLVRDSKNPDAEPLLFTVEEWSAFTSGVRGGEFWSE